MRRRRIGLVSIAILISAAASSSAAYAGAKNQHNSTVKSECITEAKGKGLSGKPLYHYVSECYDRSGGTR
jgi:hypothetical protein